MKMSLCVREGVVGPNKQLVTPLYMDRGRLLVEANGTSEWHIIKTGDICGVHLSDTNESFTYGNVKTREPLAKK
jgi:hypothetical protein